MTDPRDRSRDDRPQKPYVGGADAVPDTVQGTGHGSEPEQERRKERRGAPEEGRNALSAGWIVAIVAFIAVIVLMFGVLR